MSGSSSNQGNNFSKWNQGNSFWPYFFGKNLIQFAILLFIIALAVIWKCFQPSKGDAFEDWYSRFFDPLITFGTLFIAVYVWISEAMQDWKATWPRRMNVHFIHNGKVCMSCFGASLVHEGDIRNWAQQIGLQWGGEHLKFHPYPVFLPVTKHPDKHEHLHQARFFLRELPTKCMDELRQKFELDQSVSDAKAVYLAWFITIDDETSTPKFEEKLYLGQPTLGSERNIIEWAMKAVAIPKKVISAPSAPKP